MDSAQVLNYVNAAAAALELPLDGARAARVVAHLARTAAMAGLLDAVLLGVDDEPAELYCPAPFGPLEPDA
jgi:hypothetical protein